MPTGYDGIPDGDEDHNDRTNINENVIGAIYGVYFWATSEAVISSLDCPSSYGVQCADVGAFKTESGTW